MHGKGMFETSTCKLPNPLPDKGFAVIEQDRLSRPKPILGQCEVSQDYEAVLRVARPSYVPQPSWALGSREASSTVQPVFSCRFGIPASAIIFRPTTSENGDWCRCSRDAVRRRCRARPYAPSGPEVEESLALMADDKCMDLAMRR